MKSRTWREIATERMADPKIAAAYLKLALEEFDLGGEKYLKDGPLFSDSTLDELKK